TPSPPPPHLPPQSPDGRTLATIRRVPPGEGKEAARPIGRGVATPITGRPPHWLDRGNGGGGGARETKRRGGGRRGAGGPPPSAPAAPRPPTRACSRPRWPRTSRWASAATPRTIRAMSTG